MHPSSHSNAVAKPHFRKSWALVIGIADYQDRTLKLGNARHDAEAVAEKLSTLYGFEQVITLYDEEATREEIIEWLGDKLPAEVHKEDRLILFFAGHGISRESVPGQKRGFLVPYDGRLGSVARMISMFELVEKCKEIPAKHIFIILDCCFGGVAALTRSADFANPSSAKYTEETLRSLTDRGAWQILTAGAEDERVADSGGNPRHSSFTHALLLGLDGAADYNGDGLVTATDLAAYVKNAVIHETTRGGGKGQTPVFAPLAGSEQGDFVFVKGTDGVLVAGKEDEILLLSTWHEVNFGGLLADYTKLFVGRKDALAAVDLFLQTESSGYFAITAPAGFGKTSLMANLLHQLPLPVAYHFFNPSRVPDSVDENRFLRSVIGQLALHYQEVNEIQRTLDKVSVQNRQNELDELRRLYHWLIARAPKHPCVLMLDGLDEVPAPERSDGWSVGDYVNRELAAGLFIITSIRDEGQAWRKQFGFPGGQLTHLSLHALTEEEVVQILRAAGERASAFADDARALASLLRVAAYDKEVAKGSDPLYVRWLVEDIQEGTITAATMATQPQGMAAALDRWWEQIRSAHRQVNDAKMRMAAEALLGTLVVALGPISRQELEAIHPDRLTDSFVRDFFSEVALTMRRWLVGDDKRGYALAHPRLRDYLKSKIRTESYSQQIIAYCGRWREHSSPYAIAYYARHLVESGDTGGLYDLISKEWMEIKLRVTLSHSAFNADVNLALEAAEQSEPINWVEVMRGSMLLARLGAMAGNVPISLLQTFVVLGQVERAVGYVVLIPDADRRSRSYATLGSLLVQRNSFALGEQLLKRALTTADTITVAKTKASALSGIVKALMLAGLGDQAIQVAHQARAIANTIEERQAKYWYLGEIDKALAQPAFSNEASQLPAHVLSLSHTLEYSQSKASALGESALALALAGLSEQATKVADQSLSISYIIKSPPRRGGTLGEIAAALAQVGHREQALSIANTIEEGKDQASALTEIAFVLARAGDSDQAAEIAEQALSIAKTIEDDWFKDLMLDEIAFMLARAGHRDQALFIVTMIENDGKKVWALRKIALVLAWAGDGDQAVEITVQSLSIANRIKYGSDKASLLDAIAFALAKSGNTEQALSIAKMMEEGRNKASTLSKIAFALADAGHIDQALSIAKMIEDGDDKASALDEIVLALVRAGHTEQALSIANSIEHGHDKVRALSKIAGALVEAGHREQATKIAVQSLSIANRIKNVSDKVRALSKIAQALTEGGRTNRAAKIAEQVLSIANTFEIAMSIDPMLDEIVGVLAQAGRIDQAFSIAMSIGEVRARVRALRKIVRVLAEAGDVDRALSIANRIEDTLYKDSMLDEIAFVLIGAGDIEQALSIANTIENDSDKAAALGKLAQALARAGYIDQAAEIAVQAFTIVNSIENLIGKAWAQDAIAELLASPHPEIVRRTYLARVKFARHKSLDDFWELLGKGAPFLASIDKGATLMQVYQAIRAVESWWE